MNENLEQVQIAQFMASAIEKILTNVGTIWRLKNERMIASYAHDPCLKISNIIRAQKTRSF